MGALDIIGGILIIITGILLILVIVMQESKNSAMGALTGGTSDSYLGKNSSRTLDAMLKKVTKIATIVFFVLTVIVNAANVFLK